MVLYHLNEDKSFLTVSKGPIWGTILCSTVLQHSQHCCSNSLKTRQSQNAVSSTQHFSPVGTKTSSKCLDGGNHKKYFPSCSEIKIEILNIWPIYYYYNRGINTKSLEESPR